MDPATREPAGTGFGDQARQVFRNLDAVVLPAGGSRPELVANATVLVADMELLWRAERPLRGVLPRDPPARMTMQVPLPRGLLISIGCVAAVA